MEVNRRSGRLTLVRGKDRRFIDWKDGEIVYVSGSLPRDRLAVFLQRSRALPPAVLHALLARNFTSDTNLTRLILDGRHDTLSRLSRRVEELARRLLLEIFGWRSGRFHYDPLFRAERILRIRLGLRAQALALQAAKSLDDAPRRRRRAEPPDRSDPLLQHEGLDALFWRVMERAGASFETEEGRRRSGELRDFAARLAQRLARGHSMRPVHEDSAALLRELLKRDPPEVSAVAPIAALDPDLTLDLLILANSLVTDRRRAAATAPEALDRLGPAPVAALAGRLSSSEFPRVLEGNRAASAVRRASLAAAVAAARLARKFGIARERGYALGLLHTLPYADLLPIVEDMEIAPGRFRAALLEAHRPLVGRFRAETWSLPADFETALSDDGSDPSAAAALVRAARAALPDCALGPLPAAPGAVRPSRELVDEVNRLFEFLGLPAAKSPRAKVGGQR